MYSYIELTQELNNPNSPQQKCEPRCIWVSTKENLSSGFVNNKGADQPADPHCLISTFVIRLLECIISKLVTKEISIFKLVSVTEQAGLGYELFGNPEDRFSQI